MKTNKPYEEMTKEEIDFILKAIELAEKYGNYDNYVDVKIKNTKKQKEKEEDEREM